MKSVTRSIGTIMAGAILLGGFLGRKSDGDPGWITLWRGWEKLATLVRGAKLAQNLISKCQTCG